MYSQAHVRAAKSCGSLARAQPSVIVDGEMVLREADGPDEGSKMRDSGDRPSVRLATVPMCRREARRSLAFRKTFQAIWLKPFSLEQYIAHKCAELIGFLFPGRRICNGSQGMGFSCSTCGLSTRSFVAHGHPLSLGVPSEKDGQRHRESLRGSSGVRSTRALASKSSATCASTRDFPQSSQSGRSTGGSQLLAVLGDGRNRSNTPRSSSSVGKNGWCLQTSTFSGHKSGRSSAIRSCWMQKNVFPTQLRRCNVCSISLHRRKLNFSSTVHISVSGSTTKRPRRREDFVCSCTEEVIEWVSDRQMDIQQEMARGNAAEVARLSSKQRRVCNYSNFPWWRNTEISVAETRPFRPSCHSECGSQSRTVSGVHSCGQRRGATFAAKFVHSSSQRHHQGTLRSRLHQHVPLSWRMWRHWGSTHCRLQ